MDLEKRRRRRRDGERAQKPSWDGFQEESFISLEEVGLEASLMNCFVDWRDAGGCMAGWGRRERGTLKKCCSVL